jgi:sortase A
MRRAAIGLISLGIVVAGVGVALRLDGSRGQTIAEQRWREESIHPDHARSMDSVTRIYFPSQGDVYFVTDGASRKSLLLGPARLAWSAAPGSSGNCIILAHRDTHFRVLKDVRKDDRVVLERGGQRFEYRIVSTRVVSAADDRFYRPTGVPVLTLVTCYPFSYLGRAPQRYIVRAELLASAG